MEIWNKDSRGMRGAKCTSLFVMGGGCDIGKIKSLKYTQTLFEKGVFCE